MKKLVTALMFLFVLMYMETNAQTIGTYTTSVQSTISTACGSYNSQVMTGGTYTSLSGATTAFTGQDDAISGTITLPFTFTFGGTAQTTLRINSNGWIGFGAPTSTTNYSSLSGTTNNIIAALSLDLNGSTASYLTTGTTPNRVFQIEWTGIFPYGYSGAGAMQLWLYENSNIIEIRYGNIPWTTYTGSGQVGIRGASTAAANVRSYASGTGATIWTAPTLGTSTASTMTLNSTTLPTSGEMIRFVPQNYIIARGGTTIASMQADDAISSTITMPFTFLYGGTSQTTLRTNTNGWLGFGAPTSTTNYSALSGSTNNVISYLNMDMNNSSSAYYTYHTYGSAPYRIFVVQAGHFYNYYGSSASDSGSAQVWLYETSNQIDIHYGTFNTAWPSAYTCQVGLRGASTAAANVLAYTGTSWTALTSNNTSSNIVNIAGTTIPVAGEIISFKVPSCLTPTAVAAGSITSSGASVSFTCSGCSGSYIVEYGSTGFTPGTGATAGVGGTVVTGSASPIVLSGLSANTAYQVYVRQQCSTSSFSSNSTVVSFTTLQTPCSGTPPTGTAGAYSPVAVTGFNADVVANGIGAVSTSTSTTVDGVYNFAAPDFQVTSSSALQTNFLPASRTVNSTATPGMIFNLMPYNGNNSLRVLASSNATLTVTTPIQANKVNLLYSVGNGPAVCNITVTFTDATTQVFAAQSLVDWYTATNVAIQGIGRISSAGVASGSSTSPYLNQISLAISSANIGKSVASINVANTSTGTQVVNVFAVNMGTSSSPPSGCSPITNVLSLGNPPGVGLSGITYQWQSASVSGGPYTNVVGGTGPTTTSYTTAALNADQYFVCLVTCANGGGTALSNEVYVPVVTTPAAPTVAPSSASINQGQTATFSASASGTTGYAWYDASTGGTQLASTAGYTSLGLCAGNTYYAEADNGVCASARTAATVLMNSSLLTFESPSNGIICSSGGSVAISCSALSPAPLSYTWSNGATGTGPISVSPTTTTQYTVSADFGTCTATATVNVGVISASGVSVPSANPSVQCYASTDTVRLNANLSSGNFGVSSIPYVATSVPSSGVTTLCSAGATLVPQATVSLDDGGWSSIPLGFSYNYFGTVFTTCNVGTNGVVNFGPYSSFNASQFTFSGFPSTSSPASTIAVIANDLYLASTGAIKYWNTGIAPTRAFHLYYQNVPGFTTNGTHTVELILYETTGIVDIVVTTATSTNAKTIGLQDATQTIGAAAPGRNGYTGSITTPEAWRFSPPANYTYTWAASGSNPGSASITSTHTVNPKLSSISGPGTYVYSVAVTNPITSCVNTSYDTFTIVPSPSAPTTLGDSTICGPAHVTLTCTSTLGSTDTVRWWSAATGGTLVGVSAGSSFTTPFNVTADTTLYAEIWNGTCASSRTATLAHYGNRLGSVLTTVMTPSNGVICLTGSIAITVSNLTASTYTWSPSAGLNTTTGSNVVASPTTSTVYSVTADFGFCTVSATANVSYIPQGPVYTPTAAPSTQCFVTGDTVALHSNLSASAFSVQSIPYVATTPPSSPNVLCTGGVQTVALAGGTLDDGGWSAIPLGFTFNYFGNNYTTVNVGTNGVLEFGAFSSFAYSTFSFPSGLPSTSAPTNIIAASAVDLYASVSGTIQYWTDGVAPTRRFHLQYLNVPGFTADGLSNVEAILYETTGLVDIQVTSITCSTVGHAVTIGVQDVTGTIGSTAPGRNAHQAPPTIGAEGWRFTPPSSNTFVWSADPSNPASASITSTTSSNPVLSSFTTPGTYIYNVLATNAVTGCSAAHNDTFVINPTPATPTTTGASTLCGAYPVTFTSTVSGTDTVRWWSAATGGTIVGRNTPWTTPIITADTAYYAEVANANCTSARVRTAAHYTVPPSVSIASSNNLLCVGGTTSAVLTASGPDPNYVYTWSGTGTASGAHNETYTVLPSTTTIYSVTGSNSITGCNTIATNTVQVNTLPAPPTVSVSPDNICPTSATTLTAVAATTGYSVASIPYAPVTPTGTPTSLTLGDESISASIPIGFTFNYYGVNYTSLKVGSNGFVDFNPSAASNYCCSGHTLPTAGDDPVIGFAWTDLDQSTGGTQNYFNLTGPNRFVVRFTNVNYYTYTTPTVTTELILYQNGTIEIHTTSLSPHPNGFDGVTQGVENGTLGTAVPGCNNSLAYSATNTSYRFSPANPVTYQWTPNGTSGYMAAGQDTLSSAVAHPTAPGGQMVYTCTIRDAATTCTSSAKDTVHFLTTPTANITGPSSACIGVAETYSVVFSGTGPWSYTIDTAGGPAISGTTSGNTVFFTVRPFVSKTVRVTGLSDGSGCSAQPWDLDSQLIVVSTGCSVTWVGTADTSWHNPNNWNPILIPNSCNIDVTIPASTPNQPVISQRDIQVGSVTMGSNQHIKLNGHTLSVCKNFSGPTSSGAAYSITGTGRVIFDGSTAQTYSGYGSIDEMELNNSAGMSIVNAAFNHLSIYRGLHLHAGNLSLGFNAAIVLLSSSVDTVAWLNDFASGYTGTYTGKLTVQRKVANTGTTWQHQMAAPVSGTSAIFYTIGQATYGWHAASPLIPSSNCSEDSINYRSPYSTGLSWHENNVIGAHDTCPTRGWYTVNGYDQWAVGTGYSLYLQSNSTVTVSGSPNTGNISVSGLTNSGWATVSPEGHPFNSGWSLVGNPYPSSLDLASSRLTNGFDNQIHIFVPSGNYKGTYQPYILGTHPVKLSAFQGFMVHKTTIGGTSAFPFLQSERTTAQDTSHRFHKSGIENSLAINVSGNGYNDVTHVEFNSNATDAFDAEFDANKFPSLNGQPTLYTTPSGNANEWMGINVLGTFAKSAVVPMGFASGVDGNYTFTVSTADLATFDASINIYLEDKQNPNNWINLRTNNSYTFSARSTDNWNRFVLHFEKSAAAGITDVVANNNLNIFSADNRVLVDFTKLKNVDATIQIFNILGQELSNETYRSSDTYVKAIENVEAAYVIVKVRMADGSVVGKKLFITKQ